MRINKFLLFVCLAVFAPEAQAQSTYLWFEPQVAVEKEGEYFGTISFGHQKSPWVGLFAQTSHGNLWGETAFGPTFAPAEGLSFGVGMGVEHYAPHPIRLRLNAYYDHVATGSFLYAQFDTGKDSSWVWLDAVRMYGHVGVGAFVQMPSAGVGPKVELRFRDHVGVWVAPVYQWQEEKLRLLVGGRIMFEH
ncbi:MAG TPA: hypothetical protein VJJ48_01650 [Candidatus Paceibacterota bacterium]